MKQELRQLIEKQYDQYLRRKRWQKVVTFLAAIVVFCTTYALILPAITMEKDTVCGYDEHRHSQPCYTKTETVQVTRQLCSPEVHVHSDACFDDAGNVICGYADYIVHEHGSLCFDVDGNLVCQLPEIKTHEHTEACYAEVETPETHTHDESCYTAERGELLCDIEETSGHQHSDACYQTTYTCGMEEIPAHQHSHDCYSWELTCGCEEAEGHQHSDECYVQIKNLTCGQIEIREHNHTADCFETVEEPAPDVDTLTCCLTETEGHTHTDMCYGTWTLVCTTPEHIHDEYCLVDYAALNGGVSTMSLIQDTVVESGTIANAAGEADAITWTLTQDLEGNYTLTISGTGAMPDYTNVNQTPWYPYRGTAYNVNLVIADGITRVGKQCFSGFYLTSLELAPSVTSLGAESFSYLRKITSVTIPGTVKKIEKQAFVFSHSITNYSLGEGIESIGRNAIYSRSSNAGQVITIPASVTELEGSFCTVATAYEVAEGNEKYIAIDGVLYTKDKTTLVDYPKKDRTQEFRIPESVTTILTSAFSEVNVSKVIVPKTVEFLGADPFRDSHCKEVYIEDGTATNITELWFHYCSELTFVRFPENTPVNVKGLTNYTTYKNMSSLKIPNGTREVNLGGHLPALETVLYDAENANIEDGDFLGSCNPFQLTVGTNVNVLPAEFYHIVDRAKSIVFAGENHFTAEAGAFDTAPAPLTGHSGTFYVDAQGVLYHYDAETKTATVVMVSPGAESITIPAAIPAENETSCTVTTVMQDAFSNADGLTTLTIAAPENFTSIETHAFANCPTLTSVNGVTTVEAVAALFTNNSLVMGYGPFYNTGLTGSANLENFGDEMNGSENLTIAAENATPMEIFVTSMSKTGEWIGNESGSGGYTLLTGDTLQINIFAGNTEGTNQNTYRVYLRKTGEDCSLNVTSGQSYTFTNNGVAVTVDCLETEDPNTVCLEFTPDIGQTVNFSVTAVYPSPGSPGGGLTIWGEIVAEKTGSPKITEPTEQSIQVYWKTKPDEFTLTKADGAVDLQVFVGDDGVARPTTTMSWTIDLTRAAETTSVYGKDYMDYVEFTDVHTLNEGVTWDEDIVEAIKTGNFRSDGMILYVDNAKVFSITGNNLSMLTAKWDETAKTIVLTWRMDNPSDSAELTAQQIKLNIEPGAFRASDLGPNETAEMENTVYADLHYHYSDVDTLQDDAMASIRAETGCFAIEKTASGGTYFGEDVTYTIDINNTRSHPYTTANGCDLTDTMSQWTYIKPANMEKMFREEDGQNLTITISNAVLGTWQEITNVNSGSGWAHPGNSDTGSEETLHTLAITYDGSAFAVKVDDGDPVTGTSLAALLQQVGYGVTYESMYTCVWTLSDENGTFTLKAGEHLVHQIYATYKDSFQLLNSDWPNHHASETITVKNTAVSHKTASISTTIKREAYIYKTVCRDGELLGDAPAAGDGQILDYHLDFKHYGDGVLEDIPMVDDLYGSQYLLVPVEGNAVGLSSRTVTEDDVEYYVLTEGNYTDVKVGIDDEGNLLIADTITVKKADGEQTVTLVDQTLTYTGIHTQIKWYFPEITGNWQTTVDYKVIVDMDAGGTNAYTIGNIVWMNDRTNSRLYDPIWGGGTIIDFEKHIVTSRGDSPENDELTDYSLVGPGEQVTYRLTLHNTANYPFTLKGEKLADDLPDTYGVFDWEKGSNVTNMEIVLSQEDIQHSGLDGWTISNSYTGLAGDDQQYIVWPEEAYIEFPDESTVYLYFTLTYPKKTESDPTWDKYAAAVSGCEIQNTLYVYYFPETVTHNLRETGEVLLQKGVFGMHHYEKDTDTAILPAGSSRFFYNNRDSRDRMVEYYVMLYNGGNKRLYLDTLTDTLPDGFTFRSLVAGSAESIKGNTKNYTITVTGDGSSVVEVHQDVNFLAAQISAAVTDTGVNFTISPSGTTDTIHYDAERQKYYLNCGEAVAFGFVCDIGTTAETENPATNTVSMVYDDYLGTGVITIDPSDLVVTSKEDTEPDFIDKNDGTREVQSGTLYSQVTVERGGIIPGMTKITEKRISDSVEETYAGYALYTDIIQWRVMLHNSGTQSITDYTFQDIMPNPYSFEGEVSVTIYDAKGNEMAAEDVILTFPERVDVREDATNREKTLTITGDDGTTTYTVAFDGVPVTISNTRSITLALERDEAGNEIMTLHIEEPELSIPEGGRVDVILHSHNPGVHSTRVYENQAVLTPNMQPFTSVSHGSMLRDEAGEPVSVTNSSPVAVTTGAFTTSEKHITEKDNPSNTAVSTDSLNNRIVLEDAEKVITYTLVVQNTTSPMTKLVLIDNLPQVGDWSPFDTSVPRNSEFQVNLADAPNFQLFINDDEWESSTYTIEYSTTTDFGGPQSVDWKGEAEGTTATWTTSSENARAFRLIVNKEIPASAKIKLTFDAVVGDGAAPGEIAWNSFGYHYTLKTSDNTSVELEAMPLVVGVSIPSVPELEKRIVDSQGNTIAVEDDVSFPFLIYQGEALSGSYDSVDSLKATLDTAGCQYQSVEVTVEAGSSASQPVPLELENWTWVNGDRYTIVEILDSELYGFNRFLGVNSASYTFTYDSSITQSIICENLLEEWSIKLTKVDKVEQTNLLPGAVFGLYSPESGDQIQVPEEYQSLCIQTTVTVDGTEWYLARVQTTDADGITEFADLLRQDYYLLELRAPDGYNLPEGGWKLSRADAAGGTYAMTVTNAPGYELPESGGAGTTSYTMGGLLLSAAAILLYIHSQRRRNRDHLYCQGYFQRYH